MLITEEVVFKEPKKANDFPAGEHEIRHSEKGKQLIYVLLADERIAKVKQGTGAAVEQATMMMGNDKSKYLSSLMAGCIEIDGRPLVMEELAELPMKSYMRLQLAFSELNF